MNLLIRRRELMNLKNDNGYVLVRGLNDWGDYAIDQVYNAGLAASNQGLTAEECASYTGDLMYTYRGDMEKYQGSVVDLSWAQYFSAINNLKLNTDGKRVESAYLLYIYPNTNRVYSSYMLWGFDQVSTLDIVVPKNTPIDNMFHGLNVVREGYNIYVPDNAVNTYKAKFSNISSLFLSISDAPTSLISKLKIPIVD